MNPEQIADVLDDAADYIEQHGWCKGEIYDEDGAACALGALDSRWYAGLDDVQGPIRVFRKAIGADSIADWNDAPERTKQEVLDAFRAAAKQQRRAGDAA